MGRNDGSGSGSICVGVAWSEDVRKVEIWTKGVLDNTLAMFGAAKVENEIGYAAREVIVEETEEGFARGGVEDVGDAIEGAADVCEDAAGACEGVAGACEEVAGAREGVVVTAAGDVGVVETTVGIVAAWLAELDSVGGAAVESCTDKVVDGSDVPVLPERSSVITGAIRIVWRTGVDVGVREDVVVARAYCATMITARGGSEII